MESLMKKVLVVCLTIVGISIYADDGYVKYSQALGTVTPYDNNNIRMVEEYVVYRGGRFNCHFIFKNESDEEQTVLLGFPVYGSSETHMQSLGRTLYDFREFQKSWDERVSEIESKFRFQCFVDGKSCERVLYPTRNNIYWIKDGAFLTEENSEAHYDLGYSFYFVSEVTFAPGQTRSVVDSYYYEPSHGGDSIGGLFTEYKYILKTGRLWKGSIGKAVIRFYVDIDKDNTAEGYSGYDLCLLDDIIHGIRENTIRYHFDTKGWKKGRDNYGSYLEWEYIDLEPVADINFDRYVGPGYGVPKMGIAFYLTCMYAYNLLDNIHLYYQDGVNCDNIIKIYYSPYFESYFLRDKGSFIIDTKKIADFISYFVSEDLLIRKDKDNFNQINCRRFSELARYVINAVYAINNYNFSNAGWKEIFGGFEWYKAEVEIPEFNEADLKIINDMKKCRDIISEWLETGE